MSEIHFPGETMYRVVVPRATTEEVYIFYEKMVKKKKNYRWFSLPDSRELIAKVIAKALEERAD